MEYDSCSKSELEEIVCKFIKNKRLSKEQTNNIYFLLQDDIRDNNIPNKYYWRTDKNLTFDFNINLEHVSVKTLISILVAADYQFT